MVALETGSERGSQLFWAAIKAVTQQKTQLKREASIHCFACRLSFSPGQTTVRPYFQYDICNLNERIKNEGSIKKSTLSSSFPPVRPGSLFLCQTVLWLYLICSLHLRSFIRDPPADRVKQASFHEGLLNVATATGCPIDHKHGSCRFLEKNQTKPNITSLGAE